MFQVQGIFAPVPTCFTPSGEVDYDAFAANLKKFGATPLDGIVVMGSNGEAVSLREEEKVRLMRTAREAFPAHKKIIAGTGCESAHATTYLNKAAADAGIDVVLVINPTFFRGAMGKPEIMLDYYRTVADAAPLPVMVYNMPLNSGINIPASVVCKASQHPNIIGVKDSGGNIAQIASIIKDSAPGFSVFAGSASFLLPTLYLGGCGGTLAAANVAPAHCVAIGEALKAGDHDKARQLQMDIIDLNAAVTSGYGVPGLKYALELLGYYGGPARSPLRAFVSDEAKADIAGLMKKLHLL